MIFVFVKSACTHGQRIHSSQGARMCPHSVSINCSSLQSLYDCNCSYDYLSVAFIILVIAPVVVTHYDAQVRAIGYGHRSIGSYGPGSNSSMRVSPVKTRILKLALTLQCLQSFPKRPLVKIPSCHPNVRRPRNIPELLNAQHYMLHLHT